MPDKRSRSKRYHSEYKSHYKKFASRRPHTVKGEITRSVIPYELESHTSTPRAGLQSMQLGIIHEPPLQRKKIVPYEKNHNIFPTGTVKELSEKEWLHVDQSARERPHSSAPRLNKSSSKLKSNAQERHESPILLAEKKLLMSSPGKVTGYNYISDGLKRRSTYTQDFGKNGRQGKEKSYKEKSPVRKPKPVIGGTKLGISPDRLPPAGVRTMTSLGDKRLIKPTDNSQYMKSPDRDDIKVYDSEYSSRFKYINGAWIESPELQGRPSSVIPAQSKMDWYKEAISRRNEAYGYAHHARGTHFSRKELDRQNMLNAQCGEDNESVSEVSNHSVSHDRAKKRKEKKKKEVIRKDERPPVKKEAWMNRPVLPVESDRSFSTSYTETTATENGQFILERGRSPTPELRETGQARRHHYDMTTNILNEKLEKSLTFSPERQPSRSRKQIDYNRSCSPSTSVRSQDGSYIQHKQRDDDVMSEVSMASRATTASETFEKAKDRRDHFWVKDNKKVQIEN